MKFFNNVDTYVHVYVYSTIRFRCLKMTRDPTPTLSHFAESIDDFEIGKAYESFLKGGFIRWTNQRTNGKLKKESTSK